MTGLRMAVKKIQQLIGLLTVAAIVMLCLPLFDMIYVYPSTLRLLNDKVRQDTENVGRFVSAGLAGLESDTAKRGFLVKVADDFGCESISLRSSDGRLLVASKNVAEVKEFGALNLLRKGRSFSMNRLIAGAPQPRMLLEVQLPIMVAESLQSVVTIVQDVSYVRAQLDHLVSRATLFLLGIAAVVLSVILVIAVQVRRTIRRQLESEAELAEKQALLNKKHKDLEHLFDLVEQGKYEWQLALDCIADMILLVDTEGRIRRCNEAVIRFLELSYIDVLGKHWQQLYRLEETNIIHLDQRKRQVYHDARRVWLKLEFHPYSEGAREQLTVLRMLEQQGEPEPGGR